MGNFTNVAVLLILLCICDVQTIAKQNAHPNRLGLVWRLAFGLGLIPITLIWLYRFFILRVRLPDLRCCCCWVVCYTAQSSTSWHVHV